MSPSQTPVLFLRILKLVGVLLLVLISTLAASTILMKYIGLDDLAQIRRGFESWYWPLFTWRLGLYVTFIANYERVTRYFAQRGDWAPEHLARALRGRRFMAGNLVLLEVVISAPHWLSVIGM